MNNLQKLKETEAQRKIEEYKENPTTEKDLLARQIELENKTFNDKKTLDAHMKEVATRNGMLANLPRGQLLIKISFEQVNNKLKEIFNNSTTVKYEKRARDLMEYYRTNTKSLAIIVLETVVSRLIASNYEIPLTALANTLGRKVVNNIRLLEASKEERLRSTFLLIKNNKNIKSKKEKENKRQRYARAFLDSNANKEFIDKESNNDFIGIGKFLIKDVLAESCKALIEVKFVKKYISASKEGIGKKESENKKAYPWTVTFNEASYKILKDLKDYEDKTQVSIKPLLVEPTSIYNDIKNGNTETNNGAHTDLFKIPFYKSCFRDARAHPSNCFTFYKENQEAIFREAKTIDTINKVSYRVNKKVFELISQVFNNNIKGSKYSTLNPVLLGGLPYKLSFVNNKEIERKAYELFKEDLAVYKEKNGVDKYPVLEVDTIDVKDDGKLKVKGKRLKKDYINYSVSKDIYHDIYLENNSESRKIVKLLSECKLFLEDNFYLSMKLDRRFRKYYNQAYMDPQGSKEVKALLEFAEGYPITSNESIECYKCHGANVYGKDKLTIKEKVKFIDSIHDEIMLLGENPEDNLHILDEISESPWEWLAFCIDYAGWFKDKDNYKSHLRLAVDATCSGIQILSALSRDKNGAIDVNVINNPDDKVMDVYGKIAAETVKQIQGDACPDYHFISKGEEGEKKFYVKEGLRDLVKAGLVDRKLTKANTMTEQYGSGRYTKVEQVKDKLAEIERVKGKSWNGETWALATVLADMNIKSIDRVCKGASKVKGLLKSLTKEHLKNKNNRIDYLTPSRKLPVSLNTLVEKTATVQYSDLYLSIKNKKKETNITKTSDGFAANFVHSLDAELVGNVIDSFLKDKGTHLTIVHDSFATHAAHMPSLIETIRNSFADIFENNVLQDLVDQLDVKKKDISKVMVNTLDIQEIRKSTNLVG